MHTRKYSCTCLSIRKPRHTHAGIRVRKGATRRGTEKKDCQGGKRGGDESTQVFFWVELGEALESPPPPSLVFIVRIFQTPAKENKKLAESCWTYLAGFVPCPVLIILVVVFVFVFFLLFSSRSAQQSIHCAPLPPPPQFPGSLAISIQRCRERLSGREVGDGGKKKEGFCAKLYAGLCAGIPLSIVAFRECIPACEKCTSRKRNVSRRRCTL
jgi:hypothetical protein